MPSRRREARAHICLSPFLGVVTSTVQVFYAYRVYVMGDRKIAMPIAICIFSAVQLGFSCAGTAQIFHLKEFAKFPTWRYGVTSWLVCASVADILITGSLVYYLHRGKQNILQATTLVSLVYSYHFELTFLFDSICEKLVSSNTTCTGPRSSEILRRSSS
jgi:uncharacterized membrane protein